MSGKKVLVISSSPRRMGNSDLLADAFIEGAREAGHTVEKIRECPAYTLLYQFSPKDTGQNKVK